MTRSVRAIGLLSALAVGVATPGSASARRAEPAAAEAESEVASPELEAATQHFKQGIALYEEGDYAAALFEFRQAYAARPDYRLLYNIGVTELETNDYAAAKSSFERYLAEGGDELAPERRAEVESQLETLAQRVGTVVIHSNIEGATVFIDGNDQGTTPLSGGVLLNLGSRRIEVRHPEFDPFNEVIDVVGGAEVEVTVTLGVVEPDPPMPSVQPDPVPQADDSPGLKRLRVGTYISLGATALLGIGTAVTGTLALRADDDVGRERSRFPGDAGALSDAQDRRRTLALTTDVLLGVTLALAVTTIGLGTALLVKRRRSREPRTRAALGPGSLVVSF